MSCFRIKGLKNAQQVPFLALPLSFSRVYRAWTNFKKESACVGNFHPHYEGLCLLILKLLDMCHNCFFVLRICKFPNSCHFWHSLVAPRVFIERGKIFRQRVRGLEIVTHIL